MKEKAKKMAKRGVEKEVAEAKHSSLYHGMDREE